MVASARTNGADLAAAELIDAGVSMSFGIPGIQNLAMYAGLERAGARAVLIANEESAAFAAAGVFAASGGMEIACVNLIGGPGITHALAGITIASDQQVPMLVLTAGIKRGPAHASHRFQLHDVDNLGVLGAVTKAATTPASVEEIPRVLREALRVALTPPYGPVAVEIPSDMLSTFVPASELAKLQSASRLPLPTMQPRLPSDSPVLPRHDEALAADSKALYSAVSDECREKLVVVSDPGLCSGLAAPLGERHELLLPPQDAAVGFAIPTAIGAALVRARGSTPGTPAPPVLAIVDAQALLMTGAELTTAATERLQLILLVPTWAGQSTAPPFHFGASVDLEAFAAGFGFPYVPMQQSLGQTIRAALAEGTTAHAPCVIAEWRLSAPQPTPLPLVDAAATGRALHAHLSAAGVGLLVGCPSSREAHATMLAVEQAAAAAGESRPLRVLLATDDQSSGFVADGFSRRSRADGRIAALLIDGDAPPAGLSGVGESLMDGSPILALVLCARGGLPAASEPVAMRCARVLCKQSLDDATAGGFGGAIAPAALAARSGAPGPVAVLLRPELPPHRVAPAAAPPVAPAATEQLRAECRAVAAALAGARQPRLHLGLGALGAAPMAAELAERCACVVSSTFSGKGIVRETHPLWLWAGVGVALPPALRPIDRSCDVWLVVGAQMGELSSSHYRWPDRPIAVYHVDIDAAVPGANIPGATRIVADAAAFFGCLLETIGATTRPSAEIASTIARAHATHASLVAHEEAAVRRAGDRWISPTALFSFLQARLPAATYATDSGNGTTYGAESFRVTEGTRYMGPVNYSSMGFSVPAAIGAAFALAARASPDDEATARFSVACVGDGAFRMTGTELASAVRAKLPLIVVVLNDGELGMMSGLQRAAGGSAYCTVLSGLDASMVAKAVGAASRRVESEAELRGALEWAAATAASDGPVLLDVATSYAFPSFYSRGIAGATAPAAGKMPLAPPPVRPARADAAARDAPRDVWQFLRGAAAAHAERVAVLNHDGSAGGADYPPGPTYAELLSRCACVAAALAELGVERGDVVGVLAPNRAEVLEVHFAVAGSLHAVVLNLNYRLSADELAFVMEDAGVRWVVTDAAFRPTLEAAMALGGNSAIAGVVCLDEEPQQRLLGGTSYRELLSHGAKMRAAAGATSEPWVAVADGEAADMACEMYYTSGTSGRPKGVRLSHTNVCVHAMGCVAEHRHHREDVWGHFAPLFHLVDAYAMFSITHAGGAHAFVRGAPSFSSASVLDAIDTKRVTVTNLASAMVGMLMNEHGRAPRDLSSLELVSCGGSPLSKELVAAAVATFGCEFFLSYGMTECCGKISMSLLDQLTVRSLAPHQQLDLIATSGRPFRPLSVRLMAEGSDVPLSGVGATGEVQIKGPTVFSGYHGNDKATREAFTADGWFRTGDVARQEAFGYLTVCDRLKDMILTGGENVYSVEVERVLADHPAVLHACVYGVENDFLGEIVKAVIVLTPEAGGAASRAAQQTPDGLAAVAKATSALREHCAKLLADYKCPRTYEVLPLDELPMTGSNKIAKAQLRKTDAARKGGASLAAPSSPPPEVPPLLTIAWRKEPPQRAATRNGSSPRVLLLSDAAGGALTLALKHKSAARLTHAHPPTSAVEGASVDDAALLESMGAVSHAIFLASDRDAAHGGKPAAAFSLAQTESVLMQLLGAAKLALSSSNAVFWVVTRGAAVDFGAPMKTPNAATMQSLWGFARVIGAEATSGVGARRIGGHVVDLCPCEPDDARDAEALLDELAAYDVAVKSRDGKSVPSGTEVAYRQRTRYVPRLAPPPQPLRPAEGKALRPEGSYVITGGLGGLGLQMLQRATSDGWGGARRVILGTRSGAPSGESAQVIADIVAKTGAQIECVRSDVSVEKDVLELLRAAGTSKQPLLGVFHLAGLAGDGTIKQLTWDKFVSQTTAKIHGSYYLDAATCNRALDHFVLFTSIYGLLGNPQLSHYAAANSYQDGLAHARRQEGQTAVALSWGTWAGAGMAHRFGAGFESYWRGQGMGFIDLEDGLSAMRDVITLSAGERLAHYAYLPAQWAVYAQARGARGVQPLTIELVAASVSASPDSSTSTSGKPGSAPLSAAALSPIGKLLAPLEPNARVAAMERQLGAIVQQMVGADGAELDFSLPVSEVGLSSMHVVDLVERLAEATALELTPMLVYESVSLRALSSSLLEMLNLTSISSAAAGALATTSPTALSAVGMKLVPLPPAARPLAMEAQLRELLAEMLTLDAVGAAALDFSLPVSEVGLSSMHVVDLVERLGELTALELTPMLVYESVSLRALSNSVLEMLALGDLVAVTTEPVPRALARGAGTVDAASMSLALIGHAVRLPGESNSLSSFWQLLRQGGDAIVAPPSDRPHNGRDSGYLSSSTLMSFDQSRFGISEAEAVLLDPQQRLLLHCSYEAFLDGGMTPETLSDRNVGVFTGVSAIDYAGLTQDAVIENALAVSPYMGPAWSVSIAANRISYSLDLQGPSIAIDTACSSSLVAADQGITSIRTGASTMALITGVNVQLRRVWSDAFTTAGMLSPTNRCRFGSDDADGYVRGEGVGAALVVPFHKLGSPLALDQIKAEVVCGSVNQDGKSNGLTAPNPAAQASLLRRAYAIIDKREVEYSEAHGTGTRLGDPIELEAVGRTLGNSGTSDSRCGFQLEPRSVPLLTGSVKSNIGHLECAAGLASLVKSCMIASSRIIPRTILVSKPNRLIDFSRLSVSLSLQEGELSSDKRVYHGLSGFGFGGTNGHVVLRTISEQQRRENALPAREDSCKLQPSIESAESPLVLPISAHSQEYLVSSAETYAAALSVVEGLPPSSHALAVCRGAVFHRRHSRLSNKLRVAVVGNTVAELISNLKDLRSQPPPQPLGSAPPRVAFVFTGQGSEYIGMGQSLYKSSATFRRLVTEYSQILASFPEWSRAPLVESLFLSGSHEVHFERASFTQPALVALGLALYNVLTLDFGLCPHVVYGHSLGEISACCVGGLLSVSEALQLALVRGIAMDSLPSDSGRMLAVNASAATLQQAVQNSSGLMSFAAFNSEKSTVVSGKNTSIFELHAECQAKGLRSTLLAVGHGFHSSDVEPALPALFRSAKSALSKAPSDDLGRGRPIVISTHSGKVLSKEEAISAEHWVRHARDPVAFRAAVELSVSEFKCNAFVEVGMQPHLTSHVIANVTEMIDCSTTVSTLRKGKDDALQLYGAIGALWCADVDVRLENLLPSGPEVVVPAAPLRGSRFWLAEAAIKPREATAGPEDLIVSQASSPLYRPVWCEMDQPAQSTVVPSLFNVMVVVDTIGDLSNSFLEKLQSTASSTCILHESTDFSKVLERVAMPFASKIDTLIFRGGAPDLLLLLQALSSKAVSCSHIVVVTQTLLSNNSNEGEGNAIVTVDDSAAVRDAAAWGFVKSARLELGTRTRIQGCNFDDLSSEESMGTFCSALRSGSFPQGSVAIAKSKLLFEQLSTFTAGPEKPGPSARRGTAVITGGSGGLALQLARWLVEKRGFKHLVLASRSGRASSNNAGLSKALSEAVEATNGEATVTMVSADASSRETMRELLHSNASGLSEGGAIYHTAGVLDDGLIRTQTAERLEGVMLPKARAAWMLHELLCELEISVSNFVLFSSVTSLAGTLGQVTYGAANAALDALAIKRRSSSLPALSIQWGPWGGGAGMAAGKTLNGGATMWDELMPSDAFETLGKVLDAPSAETAVLTIAVLNVHGTDMLMERHPSLLPLFEAVITPLMGPQPIDRGHGDEVAAVSMRPVNGDDVVRVARSFVPTTAASKLRPQSRLIDFDIDSLALGALAADLSRNFECTCDVALLVSAETFEDVAQAMSAAGGVVPVTEQLRPLSREHRSCSDGAVSKMTKRVTRSRAVTGDDVVDVARRFVPQQQSADLQPHSRLIEFEIDSLGLGALAADLTRLFGAHIDVATLVSSETFNDVADAIKEAGGKLPDMDQPAKGLRRAGRSDTALNTLDSETRSRRVLGEDIVIAARAFIPGEADVKPSSRLIDFEIDSLALGALATDLTRRFGAPVDVSTLVSSETFEDVANAVRAVGGVVHEVVENGDDAPHASEVHLPPPPTPRIASARTFEAGLLMNSGSSRKTYAPLAVATEGSSNVVSKPKSDRGELGVLRQSAERDQFHSRHPSMFVWALILLRLFIRIVNETVLIVIPTLVFIMLCCSKSRVYSSQTDDEPLLFEIGELFGAYYVPEGYSFGKWCSIAWRLAILLFISGVAFVIWLFTWITVLKWTITPKISYGMRYEKYSLTWLRMNVVNDCGCVYLQPIRLMMGNTQWVVWILRLWGARIGKNVTMSLCVQPSDAGMLVIGDEVLIETDAVIDIHWTEDDMYYQLRSVTISSKCNVLSRAWLRGGTYLGEGVTVCMRSYAAGIVPPGAIVCITSIISSSQRFTDPAVAAVCTQTVLRTAEGHTVGLNLGITLLLMLTLFQIALTFTVNLCFVTAILQTRVFGGYCILALPAIFLANQWVLWLPQLLFAKWVLVGRRKPGTFCITTGYVLRCHYSQRLFQYVTPLCLNAMGLLYTPLFTFWYRLFGLKVAHSAVISPLARDGNHDSFELIEIHEDAYMSSNVRFITHAVEHRPGKPSTITFDKIVMKRRSLASPESHLFYGVTIESDAALAEAGFSVPQTTIETGIAVLGLNKRIRFKPDHEHRKAGNARLFGLYNMLFAAIRFFFFTVCFECAISFVARLSLIFYIELYTFRLLGISEVASIPWDGTKADAVPVFFMWQAGPVVFLYSMILWRSAAALLQYIALDPLLCCFTLLHHYVVFAGPCAVIGSDTAFGWRTLAHARWIASFNRNGGTAHHLVQVSNGLWESTCIPRVLHRLAGAKVGRNAVLNGIFPIEPEQVVRSFGDNCCFSNGPGLLRMWWPSHAFFGHTFGKGYMRFEETSVGEAVTICGGTFIAAGTSVPAGSHVAPLAILTNLQPLTERCATYHGQNPPRRAERNKAGDYVVPNSKILPATAEDHMETGVLPIDLEAPAPKMSVKDKEKLRKRNARSFGCCTSTTGLITTSVIFVTLVLALGLRQLGQSAALASGQINIELISPRQIPSSEEKISSMLSEVMDDSSSDAYSSILPPGLLVQSKAHAISSSKVFERSRKLKRSGDIIETLAKLYDQAMQPEQLSAEHIKPVHPAIQSSATQKDHFASQQRRRDVPTPETSLSPALLGL